MTLLVGAGVPAVLLEAGLRLFPPEWLAQRMRILRSGDSAFLASDESWPIDRVGEVFHRYVPGATIEVLHPEYQHEATIDDYGGRATLQSPGDEPLVPVFGDSFTFGVGVSDSETFLSRIGARFPGRFLNLGVTGSALYNHLQTLELRHQELGRPEIYLFVVFVGNDLDNIRNWYHRKRGSTDALPVRGQGALWSANAYVTDHPYLSRLYALQFVRQKLLGLFNRRSVRAMEPVFLAMQVDRPYLDDALADFDLELDRLVELSLQLDFRSVFVLLPDVHQLDARRREAKARSYGIDPDRLDPDRPTRAIRAALDRSGIPSVDVTACLSTGLFAGGAASLYYLRDTHFTPAGHAKTATCLLHGDLLQWLIPP